MFTASSEGSACRRPTDRVVLEVGVAVIDITPPAGLAMCGYAARTKLATGSHDPLTVRALVVADTALVVADVLGLHQTLTQRVRERCVLPDDKVMVCALHNHGGPVSMPERFVQADPDFMRNLEIACVSAIDQAVAARQPATLTFGMGEDPGVAHNRRHTAGPVDPSLPVLRVRTPTGRVLAVLVNYACHPVVLAADNLLWTADYPHFVRQDLEAAYPQAVALFVTGFVGDVSLGHSPQASISLAAQKGRDYKTAVTVGAKIATAAVAAPERQLADTSAAAIDEVELRLQRRETRPIAALVEQWQAQATTADPAHAATFRAWIDWAGRVATLPLVPLSVRVSALSWGGLPIIGLPGEIFTSTGLALRAGINDREVILAGFANDNPGYIPPQEEYQFGGYEVDEAYRYYGMPAGFAPGSAEALATRAHKMLAKFAV